LYSLQIIKNIFYFFIYFFRDFWTSKRSDLVEIFAGYFGITALTEALAALGDADSPLRAQLLGRLAMECRFSPLRERRETLG
jgi:hypothetical protein